MNKASSALLSAVLCMFVLLWWFGLVNWFITQGILVYGTCLAILIVGAIYYVLSYRDPEQAWIGADNCISLGLGGTVLGLIIAIHNYPNTDLIVPGVALALTTTGVGLICNIILYNHGIYLGINSEESLK